MTKDQVRQQHKNEALNKIISINKGNIPYLDYEEWPYENKTTAHQKSEAIDDVLIELKRKLKGTKCNN